MFTGIITHQSKILSIESGVFTVQNLFDEALVLGQSIAHDGACMTVTNHTDKQYSFFSMQESFDKTNFAHKSIGDSFNVELCMKANQRVDGHFVSGHIDSTGTVSDIMKGQDGSMKLGVSFDHQRNDYIIEKGSITLNGVSLTVVDKKPGYLSVRLIPITQKITNLGSLTVGDKINIEFDMLGKYIVNYTKNATN